MLDFLVVWNEDGGGFTTYLRPGDGGIEAPYTYDNSFWESDDKETADRENGAGEAIDETQIHGQNAPMTLRDLNRYLLERLFIELNNQNTGDCTGEYRILNYTVTNRYWTDNVIGTDIVFHVRPKAERAEELEYFQGVLACAGLTDTEKTAALFSELELPGEDDWRIVPVPGTEEVYSSEASPRMEAVIEELSGMLEEQGYAPEEADRIADTIMHGYYQRCAKWLTKEQEYSFCFRTELNENGAPVSISIDRSGGGRWNPYTPRLKTKEEQREAYFQAGYDEMEGTLRGMF